LSTLPDGIVGSKPDPNLTTGTIGAPPIAGVTR
jgi:hypothetical protein